MSDFYTGLASTAKSLLSKYGQTVTLTRSVSGTVDPITGIGTAGTSTSFTANGAVLMFSKSLIDGTNILATDKRVLIDSDNKPMINDVITTSGGDLTVLAVNAIAPSGQAVIYEMQCRV